jgi:hypothetical protein
MPDARELIFPFSKVKDAFLYAYFKYSVELEEGFKWWPEKDVEVVQMY